MPIGLVYGIYQCTFKGGCSFKKINRENKIKPKLTPHKIMQLKMIFHEVCGTGNMNGKGIAGFVAFGCDFSQGGTKAFVQEQIGVSLGGVFG